MTILGSDLIFCTFFASSLEVIESKMGASGSNPTVILVSSYYLLMKIFWSDHLYYYIDLAYILQQVIILRSYKYKTYNYK